MFINSCVKGVTYTVSSKDNEAIPQDFMEENSVLIVQLHGRKSFDKHFRKHVEKEYGGPREYLLLGSQQKSREELIKETQEKREKLSNGFLKVYHEPKFEGKYSDINKYRYFLGHYHTIKAKSELRTNRNDGFRDGYVETFVTSYTFYLLDRKTDKMYKNPITSAMSVSLLAGYIKAIEEVRVRNSK